MPHCYRGAWVSRAFAKELSLAILTIIVMFTLSGSCWARYVQGNSCLLRAVCFEYPYKVYWHESFDGHVKQHHQKLDLGRPGGHSPLTSPNNSWGNLSWESPKVWPSQLSPLLCSWDCTVVTSDRIPCQMVLCVWGIQEFLQNTPACVTLSHAIHHFGVNWNPQRNTKGISAIYVYWPDANDAAFECCNGDSWICGLPKINQNTSLQVDFCTAAAFCIGWAVMQKLVVAAGQGATVVCLHHRVFFSLDPHQFNDWHALPPWLVVRMLDLDVVFQLPLLRLCLLFAAHSSQANSATCCSCHIMQEQLELEAYSLQPPPIELGVWRTYICKLRNVRIIMRQLPSCVTVNQLCHHTDSRPTVSERRSVQQCDMSLSVHGSVLSTPFTHWYRL